MSGNILIFAGTSTMGQETARLLYQKGYKLFLTGRDERRVAPLAQSLDAPYVTCDLVEFDRVKEVMQRAQETMGSLEGVINFAGSLLIKPAHLTTMAEYQGAVQSNLTTSFAITKAAGHLLAAQGGASVVLIASAAAVHGLADHEAIAAAKAGVIGLARSAAATYASSNIRFNVVAPGLVDTALTQSLIHNTVNFHASLRMHPLGRIGRPRDIASIVSWLVDPQNDWITGQVISVDGGLSKVTPKIKL